MTETAGTLHLFSEIVHRNNLVSPQNNLPNNTVALHDTTSLRPTLQQIRHRQWLREKKILIDGSRYIQPKKDVELVTSVKADDAVLKLPIREKSDFNTDWITILFVIVLVLVATVRATSTNYIRFLFQSLINYTTSFRLFREKNYPVLHGATQLDIIFYFIFSLFIYQVEDSFNIAFTTRNILLYLLILGSVLGYFYLKKVAYFLVGLVFESIPDTNEYLFNMDIFNRTLGLSLFPVVALINYYPANNPMITVYVGIFLVAVFYIFLLQRGIFILLKKQFSIFYLFLYLCTLEILPLLLIYKVVVI